MPGRIAAPAGSRSYGSVRTRYAGCPHCCHGSRARARSGSPTKEADMSLSRPAVIAAACCTALALGLGGPVSAASAAGPAAAVSSSFSLFASAPVPPTAANPFPGVSFITPAPSNIKVAYNTQVQVTFASSVKVDSTSFFVTDARGAQVRGTVFLAPVYGSGGRENTWVFSATNSFAKNAKFTVHLRGVTTTAGATIPTATWAFSTGTSYQYGGLY